MHEIMHRIMHGITQDDNGMDWERKAALELAPDAACASLKVVTARNAACALFTSRRKLDFPSFFIFSIIRVRYALTHARA